MNHEQIASDAQNDVNTLLGWDMVETSTEDTPAKCDCHKKAPYIAETGTKWEYKCRHCDRKE